MAALASVIGLALVALGIVLLVLQLSAARRRPLVLVGSGVAVVLGLTVFALSLPTLLDPARATVIVITRTAR